MKSSLLQFDPMWHTCIMEGIHQETMTLTKFSIFASPLSPYPHIDERGMETDAHWKSNREYCVFSIF